MRSVKKVKDFFHLIISTILCWLMGTRSENTESGGKTERNSSSGNVINIFDEKKPMFAHFIKDKPHELWINIDGSIRCLWKKCLFWMQGPGDRIQGEFG